MNHRLTLTFASLAMLALATLSPASAQSQPEGDSACRTALQDAHDQILDLKATSPVNALQASRLVDEVAGSVCGFAILKGEVYNDSPRFSEDVAAVSGSEFSSANQADSSSKSPVKMTTQIHDLPFGFAFDPPPLPDTRTARIIGCKEAGEGVGTIVPTILGIKLDPQTAGGQWTAQGEDVNVVGSAADVSGTQAGNLGTMFVAAVGPLPANGSSGATCLETTTATVIKETCWWLIFWTECTQKVEFKTSLEPCSASADQDMLNQHLLIYEHEYKVKNDPCERTHSMAAPASGRVVSDTVQELTVRLPVGDVPIPSTAALGDLLPFSLG